MKFKEKSFVGAERLRCFEIVQAYRESIEIKMDKRPLVTIREQAIADAIIKALLAIEREIKHPKENMSSGEFSLDEMAIAEKLIAEQEENPFEV